MADEAVTLDGGHVPGQRYEQTPAVLRRELVGLTRDVAISSWNRLRSHSAAAETEAARVAAPKFRSTVRTAGTQKQRFVNGRRSVNARPIHLSPNALWIFTGDIILAIPTPNDMVSLEVSRSSPFLSPFQRRRRCLFVEARHGQGLLSPLL
jgi:hypothetical protein